MSDLGFIGLGISPPRVSSKFTAKPGSGIALHQKDLDLALQNARMLDVSLPNTAGCQQMFNAAIASGGAAWDHSGLVCVIERLACPEIRGG